ncbi:MAG: NAD(+) synthase [Prevotella sp.]
MQNGYIKVASAVPSVRVADCDYNIQQIESLIAQAEGKGVEIIVFPELSVTGYSCQDLFCQSILVEQTETALLKLLDFTRQLDIISIVGMPVKVGDKLLNCAAVIQKGDLLGIIPKQFLPNYGEFYEKRWFDSSADICPTEVRIAGRKITVSNQPTLFRTYGGVDFGIEICEDLWSPVPPSNVLTLAGAKIIFNLSASDELIGKHAYLTSLVSQQSARTISAYVYSCCGFGESTQDVVYGGNAMIYENGRSVAEGERFCLSSQLVISQIDVEMLEKERMFNTTFRSAANIKDVRIIEAHGISSKDFELIRTVNPHPFIPQSEDMTAACDEIFSIQVAGLAKRLTHTNSNTVVLGISGGLDSTLALLVCVRTFDKLGLPREGVVGVTMPGFGTTDRTYNNAISLMRSLGVTIKEISIRAAVEQHFSDIGHDINVHDVTYENSQARERTQILMDLANQLGAPVIGTGDLSELALGWATYNGDHMSMYGVNAGVPKTLIRYLVNHVADTIGDEKSKAILLDVIDTPISPELIPADEDGNISQKTEDLVGPYELHDFFLFYMLRYGYRPSRIYMLAKHAFDGHNPSAGVYNDDTIKHWLTVFCRRFFSQQFKRSCMPDGPKVGSVSLSPRGDWRMPSDASAAMWIRECETL